jgi:predicted RNA polymerase sigma factor
VTADSLDAAGENLLRELAPQVLGAMIRRFGDFSASEDAVQEALLAAAMQWPEEGVPDNPRGWLIQVAARRMTDHLRTELARRRREAVVVMQVPADEQVAPPADALSFGHFGSSFAGAGIEDGTEQDDTLILLFMCCHPALTRPSAIALTELIPLTEQDRTLWDRAAISEGVALITDTLSRGSIGSYQLQAAIAAVHDEAARAADTDWPQILALYGLLERMSDNPMVKLNHAVATAMVHGPAAGLELLKALDADGRLTGHHRLDAVRAHLLERAGDHQAAIAHYRTAASRTTSMPERNYLMTQAARLSAALG